MTFPLTDWTAIKASDQPPTGWYWWRDLPYHSPAIRYIAAHRYHDRTDHWTVQGSYPWSEEQGEFCGEWKGPLTP